MSKPQNRSDVKIGMIALAAILSASPASAQSCRNLAYIPGVNAVTLQNEAGTTISLQHNSRNYHHTVRVWENNNYVGEYYIPVSFASGEIQVKLKMKQRLETWLGQVRQTNKHLPYITVCGNWSDNLSQQ
jgi:hypothetical protein